MSLTLPKRLTRSPPPTADQEGRAGLCDHPPRTLSSATRCIIDWMNARLPDPDSGDVVVNLTGDINPPRGDYESANTRTAERLQAHFGGRAAQAIFISFPGASTISANRYLRTKAEAEALTLNTARCATILRTVYICGKPDSPGASDLAQRAGFRLLQGNINWSARLRTI